MFCPKCKFTTFDHLSKCPKCSYDWSDARKKLNLDWLLEPAAHQGQSDQSHLQLVKSGQQAAQQTQEQGELFEGVLSEDDEQAPSPVVEDEDNDSDTIELEPEPEEETVRSASEESDDNSILDLGSLEEEQEEDEGQEAGEITVDDDISFPELDEMLDDESSGGGSGNKPRTEASGGSNNQDEDALGQVELENGEAGNSNADSETREEDSDFDDMEDISSLIDDIFPEEEQKGSGKK
jgi:hypothetical protein